MNILVVEVDEDDVTKKRVIDYYHYATSKENEGDGKFMSLLKQNQHKLMTKDESVCKFDAELFLRIVNIALDDMPKPAMYCKDYANCKEKTAFPCKELEKWLQKWWFGKK